MRPFLRGAAVIALLAGGVLGAQAEPLPCRRPAPLNTEWFATQFQYARAPVRQEWVAAVLNLHSKRPWSCRLAAPCRE